MKFATINKINNLSIITALTIVLLLSVVLYASTTEASDVSVSISSQHAYNSIWSPYKQNETTNMQLSVRKYINKNWFTSLNHNILSAGDFGAEKGNLFTVNMGYKTSGKFYTEYSVGIGYLDNLDSYLGNHRQFELSAGAGYRFTNNISAGFKVTHVSSCAQICGFNRGQTNKGREYMGFQIEFKL